MKNNKWSYHLILSLWVFGSISIPWTTQAGLPAAEITFESPTPDDFTWITGNSTEVEATQNRCGS
jgi:hypothetical protein